MFGALALSSAFVQRAPASDPSCSALPKVPPTPVYSSKVRGEYLKNGKTLVQDIYLRSATGPHVRAFLITPQQASPNRGAVFFVHLLAPPPDNDREEFFEDALELADSNVESLLVEAPWADPEWFPGRTLDQDLPNVLKYVSELVGQFKVLADHSKAATDKIAFAGHDFGAMYGALMLKEIPSIRHAVLMAAVPDFADWFLLGRKLTPDQTDAYRKRLVAVSPSRYLKCSGATDVLFQFAETDRFVTRKQADDFTVAAPSEKKVLWYPGGHELQAASRADRVGWLKERVGRR